MGPKQPILVAAFYLKQPRASQEEVMQTLWNDKVKKKLTFIPLRAYMACCPYWSGRARGHHHATPMGMDFSPPASVPKDAIPPACSLPSPLFNHFPACLHSASKGVLPLPPPLLTSSVVLTTPVATWAPSISPHRLLLGNADIKRLTCQGSVPSCAMTRGVLDMPLGPQGGCSIVLCLPVWETKHIISWIISS